MVKSASYMWLLSGLTANLQHHMTYTCKVRKYGTLIYRPNTDLIPSLQKAMWSLRQSQVSKVELNAQSETVLQDSTQRSSRAVLDDLNSQVHKEVRRILTKDGETSFQYDRIDIDTLIKEANPQLWEAICLLTRSVSERKGTTKQGDPASASYHTKKLRRFFLLCSILFCTDDRCSQPLHTLVTDVVDGQGGSAQLVRILNRLGVCTSIDSLSCFIQNHIQQCKDEYKDKCLNPTSFTVVSAGEEPLH